MSEKELITNQDVKDYYSYDECVELLTDLVNKCYQAEDTYYVGEDCYQFARSLNRKLFDAKLNKKESEDE